MKTLNWGLVGLILLIGPPTALLADTEQENADLARIEHVLGSLTPLINQAEAQQDKTAREQFQYETLRSDIAKIKQGIAEKLQQVPIGPRTVTPIQGDYLKFQGKHQ